MRKLNFAVIGVQKAATSWLFENLRAHPELLLPRDKREIARIAGPKVADLGMDWYWSRFESEPGLLGDVSVDYMYYSEDLPSLREHMVDSPRLIISLRNRLSRFESAYGWCLRTYGRMAPIDDIVSRVVKTIGSTFPEEGSGEGNGRELELFLRGLYGRQLERVLEVFGSEGILIVCQEEIKDDPYKVLRRIFSFLGVRTEFIPASVSRKPKRSSGIEWLARLEGRVETWWIKGLLERLNRIWPQRPPHWQLSMKSRKMLANAYQADIHVLEQCIEGIPSDALPGPGYLARVVSA